MNGQLNFTAKVEPEDFKNTLFLAMELSRSTWLVATFAPRLRENGGAAMVLAGHW